MNVNGCGFSRNNALILDTEKSMQGPVSEIASYIDHHDYDLAVRRILDFSRDAEDASLITDAIHLSEKYHRDIQNNDPVSDEFIVKTKGLLDKFSRTNIAYNTSELLVEAHNITKSYLSGYFSLKPASVEIRTGDILGVVGENGNGKTTLLRCLAGQLGIDGGEISYSKIRRVDYYNIKSYVAFIPQRIPRWYGRLKDNLHFSASIAGVYGEENKLLVDFMLERLSLSRFANLTWDQISSGYRTRFEIARVLLQKPSLLILDEPLANLDIKAQQTILTDLRFMTKSVHHPMGVILSSQQLHEVEKIADNVMFIKDGVCISQVTTETATEKKYILEIETKAERETIVSVLGNDVEIRYNGGFYTISSTSNTSQEMVKQLIESGVETTYFRDITHSAKRFFN